MSTDHPFPDLPDVDPFGSEDSRFWELIAQQGYAGTPMNFRVTLECQDAATADSLVAYLRTASYERVDVRQEHPDPSAAPVWQIVAHTGVRPLTHEYFFSLRRSLAETIQHFRCRFHSFTGSKGRAA